MPDEPPEEIIDAMNAGLLARYFAEVSKYLITDQSDGSTENTFAAPEAFNLWTS